MIHVQYTCKKCNEEIEVEVVINEEADLPEICPACGAVIPDKAYEEVQESALDKARDSADMRDYD